MRFLGNYNDPAERAKVSALLEAHGIPTYKQGGLTFGEEPRALFVCFDDQYEDAIALLSNENHRVRRRIDMKLFSKAKRIDGLSLELKCALLILAGVALLFACVLAAAWWQGVSIWPRGYSAASLVFASHIASDPA